MKLGMAVIGLLRIALVATALAIANNYVSQQRYVMVGFCPPTGTRPPSALLYDTRDTLLGCLPLPSAAPDVVNPNPDANPKREM